MIASGQGVLGRALASLFILVVALLFSLPAVGADLSSLVTVTKSERSLTDRRTMMVTTTATIKITNNSQQSIAVPLHGVFDISSTGVTVLNAIAPNSVGNPYNKYYVDLSSISGGSLNSGASVSFTVNLVCKSTIRYSYKVLAYGTLPSGNQAPTANAGPNQTVNLPYGQSKANVTLDGSTSRDIDGTIASYTWSGTPKPANQAKPVISLPEGQHIFTLTVTDNQNATSQPASVTINVVKETVRLPQITISGTPPYQTNAGASSPLNISVAASSPDGRQVTLSAAPFIKNGAFSATTGLQATGAYILRAGYGQQGKYMVTFTARDTYGLSSVKTVQIEVVKTNRPPELTMQPTVAVDEGKSLLIPVSATDPDGDTVTLTATGIPTNAMFIPATGTISFTPDFNQQGNHTVTVRASDGTSSVQKSVVITVNDVPAGGGSTPLTLTVDPVETPNFLATQRITGQVNSTGTAQPAQKTALITGLSPTGGEQGALMSVNITGDAGTYATHFAAGKSTLSFGSGITVKQFTVTGPTSATAQILIDPSASTGVRQVMVTTGSETALSVNAFSVNKGSMVITGRMTDENGNPLANATILIQGTNLTTTSGADGFFSFSGVFSGAQTIIVSTPNRELLIIPVNTQVGVSSDVGVLQSKSTVFDPTAPPSVSVMSVVGRGATRLSFNIDRPAVRKLISDAILLVGGSDGGILDEYGVQTNPNISGKGLFSLTTKGVETLADRMLLQKTYSLPHMLLGASFAFQWGGSGQRLTLQEWLTGLQGIVNQAWADPSNPDNYLPLLIFNSGNSLSPTAPTISFLTRLNALQAFLLNNSLIAYMQERTP